MAGAHLNADVWINEYISPHDIYSHGVEEILASAKTQYQDMHVVRSGVYGKGLVLDGKWQSCTGDEFLYHEPLVQAPLTLFTLRTGNAPKRILILGGGEGATVREALRWDDVETVRMVDLDGDVVEACKQHLPEMHQGAFDDPRTDLVIGDALHELDNPDHPWDIIISDLSDPIEDGPSFPLFTKEYYQKCRDALSHEGILVVQAGPTSPSEITLHARVANTVNAVFPHIANYHSPVPTYAVPWGFVLGSSQPLNTSPDPDTTDQLLATHLKEPARLRMFDGCALLGMLQTSKFVRDAIKNETTVYTTANPPKFFGTGADSRRESIIS